MPSGEPPSQVRVRALALLAVPVLLQAILLQPVSSGYVTYYSGDDITVSLAPEDTAEGGLREVVYGNLTEDFASPPYSFAEYWCRANGWAGSGNCPCLPGILTLSVNPRGQLEWHNWLHMIGGAVYNFQMSKEFDPASDCFELYVPISINRPPGPGIAGAPPLKVCLRVSDRAGTVLSSLELLYNGNLLVTASIYSQNTTLYTSLRSLDLKIWQDQSGARISLDNGTTSIMAGRLYTPPSRIEIGFSIWEHNEVQPYSDGEFSVLIEGVTLLPLCTEGARVQGLTAGAWYLLDSAGNEVEAATLSESGSMAVPSMTGTLAGMCNYTYAKQGVFSADMTLTYNDRFGTFLAETGGSDLGMVVQGIPEGDVLSVYKDGVLVRSMLSNGQPLTVPRSAVAQPFSGRLEVTSRPYLRPLASYSGMLEWCDALSFSGGTLVRSANGTGAQTSLAKGGSECGSVDGWSLTYNLVTGGLPPSLSASNGLIVISEPNLSYRGGGTQRVWMEAYYWLSFPFGVIGKNFSVSVLSDAAFSFSSGGTIYQQYAEITLYCESAGQRHLLASSSRSLTPRLESAVAFSPSELVKVDSFIIEVHAYAQCHRDYALYSSNDWVRVDYLRVSCEKLPDDHLLPVTGLRHGWSVSFGPLHYWSNSSGAVGVPIDLLPWPLPQEWNISVIAPSELYSAAFEPGKAYCVRKARPHEPPPEMLFFETAAEDYCYGVELRFLSFSSSPSGSGTVHTLRFTYSVNDNGTLRQHQPLIRLDELPAVIVDEGGGVCSISFSLPIGQSVRFCAVDRSGIRLSCRIAG